MYKIKNDAYKKSRGGKSKVLDVCCEVCKTHISYYQKDGPGLLKRMYVDRFIDFQPKDENLKCSSCGRTIGVLIEYKKENRPAYRLFEGAVSKKIKSARDISICSWPTGWAKKRRPL